MSGVPFSRSETFFFFARTRFGSQTSLSCWVRGVSTLEWSSLRVKPLVAHRVIPRSGIPGFYIQCSARHRGVFYTRISAYCEASRRGGVGSLRFLDDVAALEQIKNWFDMKLDSTFGQLCFFLKCRIEFVLDSLQILRLHSVRREGARHLRKCDVTKLLLHEKLPVAQLL
jgi:hypothetical protein